MNFSDVLPSSNRKFGFFFALVFVLIGGYFLNKTSNSIAYIFFVLSLTLLLITLIKAELLHPLNKLWMRFGFLLGMIINPIVLGIIFFGLFTPISFLMKLFNRDELYLKLSSSASHWKERSADFTQTDTFKNQF